MVFKENGSAALTGLGDEVDLLVQVARMYYEQQLTQGDIGQALNISRSTISRLLQKARDEGIVQITIHDPRERETHLESLLVQTFGLRGARVLRNVGRSPDEAIQGMGQLAARVFDESVEDGMIVGVSYGRSVASTIHQLKPTRKVNLLSVQIIGALGSANPMTEVTDLVRELANVYGTKYRYLHAPLIVEDRRARDLLLQEPTVQETLATGRRADIILIGIGSWPPSTSESIWTGYLTKKEQDWIRNVGGCGHMCAQFFDDQGDELDIDINKRTIGIGLSALRAVKHVIAIAGTQEKAPAILGALRGGYIDTLVTDEEAARAVMQLLQAERELTLSG